MSESYCPSCYRAVPRDSTCSSCAERHARTRPAARLPLRIGAAGLPLLIFGMLTYDIRVCVAGAIVAACGIVTHIVLTLRAG